MSEKTNPLAGKSPIGPAQVMGKINDILPQIAAMIRNAQAPKPDGSDPGGSLLKALTACFQPTAYVGKLAACKNTAEFTVRIVYPGESYGLDFCILNPPGSSPIIEFYDRKHTDTLFGYFVSRYNLETLRERTPDGIMLDTASDKSQITKEQFVAVLNWIASNPRPTSLPYNPERKSLVEIPEIPLL